ncbi:MAG: AAA family ATPase [Chloroflexota bacterium]|nr:AAA family ATPase [Chloroflexota bacterium]
MDISAIITVTVVAYAYSYVPTLTMHFYLIGQLRTEPSSEPGYGPALPLPRLRKARGLLAYLLLFSHTYHSRDHLAALFWGDADEGSSRASLSNALAQIRDLVAQSGASIKADRFGVQLDLAAAWLDVATLQRGLTSRDRATIEGVLPLYTADLLAGWSDEWCIEAREQLRQAVLTTGTDLLDDYLEEQQWQAGTALAQRLLTHDPLNDTLHDLLLQLLLGAGEYKEARRHYQAYAALLRRELAIDPAGSTRELYEKALRATLSEPGAAISAGARLNRQASADAGSADRHSAEDDVARFGRLPFVGRVPERKLIGEAIAKLRQGQGGMLFVRGEAGVGKTRLVEEALAQSGIRRVARGQASELSREVPFAPLLAPLSAWLLDELAPAQVLSRLGPAATAAIASLLPSLSGRISAAGLRALPTLPSVSPADAHVRMLQSIVSALKEATSPSSPVVLFLDDLQYADSHTLQVLEQLRGQLHTVPLLVIGTYRSEDAPGEGSLSRLVEKGTEEEVTLLEVPYFTPEETRSLVEGRTPPERAALSQWLHKLGGGNAFYTAELLRSLQEQRLILPDAAAGGWRIAEGATLPTVPAGSISLSLDHELKVPRIAPAIMQRFNNLSVGSQRLVLISSVLVEASGFDLLLKASDLHEEEALAGLEEALSRHFMQERGSDGSYLVEHELIRQTIYASTSTPRRQLLHGQIAAIIEGSAGEASEPANRIRILKLAYHYGRTLNRAKQQEYFWKAAETAHKEYANEVAIDYGERLLPLLPPNEQVPVLLQLEGVYSHTGHVDKAEELCLQAIEAAESLDSRPLLARSHVALATVLINKGDYDGTIRVGETAYKLCKEVGDKADLAEIAETIGHAYWTKLDYTTALSSFREQRRLAEELEDEKRLCRALANIGKVLSDMGELAEAREYLREAAGLSLALGDSSVATRVYWSIGYTYVLEGNYAQAIPNLLETLRIGTETGHKLAAGSALSVLGTAYRTYGDLPMAYASQAWSLSLALSYQNNGHIAGALNGLAAAEADMGRFACAERNLQRANGLATLQDIRFVIFDTLCDKAALLKSMARYAEAQQSLLEASSLSDAVSYPEQHLGLALLTLEVAVALGTRDLTSTISACEDLLPAWPKEPQRAAIFYTIWELDPSREAARTEAARLYKHLYSSAPSAKARLRYEKLTGERLPDPPPVPPLPVLMSSPPEDLDALLDQVDALIAGLTATPN